MSEPRIPSMSRRGFLSGAAGLGGLALLSACGGGSSAGAKGTITHWDKWTTQQSWVKKEMERFQKATGIQVDRTLQASGNLEDLLNLAARGGNLPDVFMVARDRLDEHIKQGHVLALNKYATADWQKTFPAHSFVNGVNAADGKIYSAPFTGFGPELQLYINNKVFKDAGLVDSSGQVLLPKTWDDVTRAAEQITRKGNGSVHGIGFGNSAFPIINYWIKPFLAGSGNPVSVPPSVPDGLDLRTGKFTRYTDRTYTDFLNLFLEWKNKGYIMPSSLSIDDEISRQQFARGKFGMIVGGVWNQPGWIELGFTDFSTVAMVTPDGQQKSSYYHGAGSVMLAISADSKRPDEAWEWFKWWHGKDAATRFVQDLKGDISVHPEANDPSKIDLAPFKQYVEAAKLVIPGPQPSLRNPATIHVVPDQAKPTFDDFCTGVYTGQIKDVEGGLRKLAEDLEGKFEDALKKAKDKGHKVSREDYVFADWDLTKPYKWDIPQYLGA
ncbi:ABC transporter substrate-binding protein [Spirillospora sp. CA-253888]